MGLTEQQTFEIGGGINCQNPDCGHTPEEHPFSNTSFDRHCTKCDCKSYEFLTRLNTDLLQNINYTNTTTTDIPLLTDSNLTQQIDELENALEKSQKEIEDLKKKLKNKDAKNQELEYTVGLLKIELELSENVKRNLKHIIDKE